MNPTRKFLLTAAALLLLQFTVAAAADDLLRRAQQLLDENRPADAYELLQGESEQRAGTPEFDLMLGIAARAAGHPTRAVFALERVLAVQPDNDRARAELARAYYDTGENEASRAEFQAVRKEVLSPALTRAVDEYLAALDRRFAATKRQIRIFLQGTAGYDGNVNSATDTSQVAIPAIGNLIFTLDRSGRELSSGFFELAGGFMFSSEFLDNERLRIFGGADLSERIAFDETDFNLRVGNGHVGLRYSSGVDAYQISVQGQRFMVGGARNRDQGGATVQWLRSFSPRTQGSVFGQFAAQRFPHQEIRDVNQFSGGVGIVHAMDRQGNPVIYASAFAGVDDELAGSRPDIGRTFAGVRTGGQYGINDRTLLVGGVSYQYSWYGAADPLFLERRRDHFVLLRGGLVYGLTPNWSVRPEIQYIHNDSTLVINEFDRWQAFVTIRNQF
jgi:hypothetical protein